MQDFQGKKILLGVTGGIAGYKAACLARELIKSGAEVRVVMTEAATAFVTPLTFQALTGNAVHTALLDTSAERAMGHIELARWADWLLVAPASADMLAKFAHGIADDLLSTLYLATRAPVMVCPAMNRNMWDHPATQANITLLANRGVWVTGPDTGSQACGDSGPGRMSEPETIMNALRLAPVRHLLKNRNVLITAGPTQEAIDPVRYLSNHSSGKMGYALAEAAHRAGAQVTLISGPVTLPVPEGIRCHVVNSAAEMENMVMAHLEPGTIFIAAAAVADYAPASISPVKLKKDQHNLSCVELVRNPDIVARVAASGRAAFTAGFALETENTCVNATRKLQEKGLDMIVANEVGEGRAFGSDFNEVVIITKKGQTVLPRASKMALAGEMIAILAATLQNSAHLTERTEA